jgi:hypothetical protein
MYCPSCGAESALDLNYCNRCGANMVQALAPSQQIAPISITKPALAIGLTTLLLTLGGFAVLAIAAYNLAQVFPQPDPILAILVLGMFTILVSDIMLIRLLSRIVRASLDTKQVVQLPKPATQGLPRQLSPRLDPVPSVTEHTTRTFTPVFKETPDRGTK